MMLFLIEYNRNEGRIVTFEKFSDNASKIAKNARLEMELDLNRRGVEREVVLLQAVDEAALRRTHQRYFAKLAERYSEKLAELARVS
jgi:hypothetical protein